MSRPYRRTKRRSRVIQPSGNAPRKAGGRRWLPRAELARRLAATQADSGLRDDLARLAGETTDDLPPLT